MLGYITGLAKNARLIALSTDMLAEAKAEYETHGVKGRVIAHIEHMAKGTNPRYVVTNLQGEAAHLYEKVYCARGEMENRIKEQQHQMFGSRTSCHDFLANQLRVTLAAAAYTLVKQMQHLALKGTDLENAEVGTLRLALLKIGAQIEVSARRFVLKLSSYFPRKEVFQLAARRLALDTT